MKAISTVPVAQLGHNTHLLLFPSPALLGHGGQPEEGVAYSETSQEALPPGMGGTIATVTGSGPSTEA